MRFCALLEVPRGIFGIYGSSSWDFVHYLKSMMVFCTFSEALRGILRTSKNAENPVRNFQK
jgi:hypothetical protein